MKILQWILAIVLAIVMALAAITRLVSSDTRSEQSDMLNIPGWLLIIVSIIELVLVVDLLLPRFRILGALGVFATMLGAIVLNAFGDVVNDVNPRSIIPINVVLAVVALVTAWLAGDRPSNPASLIATARRQMAGQFDAVTDLAADVVD